MVHQLSIFDFFEDNSDKTILSLFDYSGNWSKPYREAGYNVIQFDIKDGWDILENFPNGLCEGLNVVGILAGPPCTDFAASGARWWEEKDQPGSATCECCKTTTEHSELLVSAVLALVEILEPEWWVIENPVGRLPKIVPEIGEAKLYFNPCDYGDPYTKRTGLWGEFNTDLPKNEVEPTEGSMMWRCYGGKSEKTKKLRSDTPMGFSYAFFAANP